MLKKKTLDKLSAMLLQACVNAESNTDEQALQVSTLYPEWESFNEGQILKNGMRINYNGTLYKVITEHEKQESWNPQYTPSLFTKVLIENPEVIPEWEQPDSTNAYKKGDKVMHDGVIYKSLVDNNVWEPGVAGTEGLWEVVV